MQVLAKQSVLNPRDIIVLEFLARVGYCQERHLIKLLNLDKITIYNQIRSLVKRGLVTKDPFIRGEDYFILLAKAGANLLEVNPAKKLILNTLYHDMLVIDLLLHLMHNQPHLSIKTDRELKRELGLNQVGVKKLNISDLLIDDNTAIEVELTAKAEARLREIVNSYILNPKITQVHYYVKSRAIANRVFNLAKLSNKFRAFLFTEDISVVIEIFAPQVPDQAQNFTTNISSTRQNNPLVHFKNDDFNLDDYLNG